MEGEESFTKVVFMNEMYTCGQGLKLCIVIVTLMALANKLKILGKLSDTLPCTLGFSHVI